MNWFLFRSGKPIDEADLQAWADDRLPSVREEAMRTHLALHPEDAARAESYRRQRDLLRALREDLAIGKEEAFRPELLEAVAQRLGRSERIRRAAMAAAVAMLMITGGSVGWLYTYAPERSLPITQMASHDLLFDPSSFARAERVAAEDEDSVGWLDRHLTGRSLRRPDLEKLGLRFVRGRVLRHLRTPAIRLVYEDERGSKIFIYLGVLKGDEDQALGIVPEGYVSLQWRNGPVVFALIGPSDSPQLVDAMQLISNSVAENKPAAMEAKAQEPPAGAAPAAAAGGEVIKPPSTADDAGTVPAATETPSETAPPDPASVTKPL